MKLNISSSGQRLLRQTLFLSVIAAAIWGITREASHFDLPHSVATFAAKRIGRALRRHDVFFYLTLDEPTLMEWSAQREIHAHATRSVPGRFGSARHFNGRKGSHIETSCGWQQLGESFTMALWLRLQPTLQERSICYASHANRPTGLRLRADAHLDFTLTSSNAPQQHYRVQLPCKRYETWTHLVITVDSRQKELSIYRDGLLQDRTTIGDFALPGQNIEFGKLRWYVSGEPFKGDLDEVIIWRTALTPAEVRRLARRRTALVWRRAPLSYTLFQAAVAFSQLSRNTARFCDNFNPLSYRETESVKKLPKLSLYLSKHDRAHFARQHEQSIRSGAATSRGLKPRRISLACDGEVVPALLSLDSLRSGYPAARPSYIVTAPGRKLFGCERLRLLAPESFAANLSGLLADPLHDATNGLCRLLIDGQPNGVYYFEKLRYPGLPSTPVLPLVERKRFYKFDSPYHYPTQLDELLAAEEGCYRPLAAATLQERGAKLATLLAADVHHPWSRSEWRWHLKRLAATTTRPDPLFDLNHLLGSNPATLYITNDLNLATAPHLTWHSSQPEVIANDGTVKRPTNGVPLFVTLRATLRSDSDKGEVACLTLRCMPDPPPVSAIFVHTATERFTRTERQPFIATLLYPGEPPRQADGFLRLHSGIKLRGNTSFFKGHKGAWSLKFDEPQPLPDSHLTARKFQLINGYSDNSRLRNALAYELFRSFSTPEQPRLVPEIAWCDLFINGAFLGLYEFSASMEEQVVAALPATAPPLLFKHGLFDPAERIIAAQRLPRARFGTRTDELLQLRKLFEEAAPSRFVAEVANHCELDNLVDLTILLNVTGNTDGLVSNYYLARSDNPAARFFFVPWDYDKTFFTDQMQVVRNPLIARLWQESPAFYNALHRRWQELRRHQLSDSAMLQLIDTLSETVAPAIASEYYLYPALATVSYAEQVGELKQVALARLKNCDRLFSLQQETE